jgi:hypothetical protein
MNLAPILIIGAGRGGTSLLAACLGGHPYIVMRSEYHSAQILRGDDEPIGSVARLLDDRLAHFTAVCNENRAQDPDAIWGNKITTEHIGWLEEHNSLNRSRVDVVARFAASLAEYRKIFIIRDGRSCVDSKVRRAGIPMIRAALRWCYCVRVLDRLSDLGDLCAVVRYEDLVRWPAEQLTQLCEALEINFHPAMLEQTNSETLLPSEYRHGRFLHEKAAQVPVLPDAVLKVIAPDLKRLGYFRPPFSGNEESSMGEVDLQQSP